VASALAGGWRLEIVELHVGGLQYGVAALTRHDIIIYEGCLHAWVASPLGLRGSDLGALISRCEEQTDGCATV
jgi:hypothetical protein